MSKELRKLFMNRIALGLHRKGVTTCSKWAESYRVMGKPFPGPWSFKHHPWVREMHDCEAEEIVGKKAAQMAYTETALNKTFFNIDVKGTSVLYVLPATTPDASDFSASRFDPALELSAHLKNLFSDVANVGHKRAGSANLFVRGSRSRNQMKSLPVSFLVFDELDEMNLDNVTLANERLSGQVEKQVFKLSTPTIDNYGIDESWRRSTMERFFFRCPHCSQMTNLYYPECLIIVGDDKNDPRIKESHLICPLCKHKLAHEDKINYLQNNQWVAEKSDRDIRGFHVSQLYSMTVAPWEIAASVFDSQRDPAAEQELYNSKLGETRVVEGARVTEQNIRDATGTYKKYQSHDALTLKTIGIDVGIKYIHYVIMEWKVTPGMDINAGSDGRLIAEGKVEHMEELDAKIINYRVRMGVIDANPERRKALELAQRFHGRLKLCFYARGLNTRNLQASGEETNYAISVDRTAWLDMTLGRFRRKKIKLPCDVSLEYRNHIKALVRVFEKDDQNNPIGRYLCGNEDDHFAHAQNYAEIALALFTGVGNNEDIRS
jgi:hypothetical protein